MESYVFTSNNSPRLVIMFKASMVSELARKGKQLNIVDETETQVTFTGFEAGCLADAIVSKMREEKTFRGEHLALHVINSTI